MPRAGWAGRHVEGLEVVPVGLGLGTFGHREAHGDEGVLQLVPGLGDQVEVAPPVCQGPPAAPCRGPLVNSVRSSRSASTRRLPVGMLERRDRGRPPVLAGGSGRR